MSLSTNMQTLIEEKSLLQAQLEVQEQNSAARIRELEQKVNTLEVHKRMSARKPDDQAVQPAMPTSSSDPDLRAEIAQLRGQGSELLGMVRKYDEVFDKVEKGFTASAAALRSTKKEEFDKLSKSVVEAIHNRDSHPSQEHQPQKESKASLSVANTENSKPSSTPPTKGFGAEVPFRPNPVPPATPFKFQDNSPTAPSQPTCAGALQKPREEAQRKPRVNPNVAKQPSTHSEFTAKKEAEQQRQGRSDKPNKSHGLGGAIRGEPKDRGSTHGEARGRGSTTRRGRTPKAPTSGELSPHTGSTVNDPCKDARPAD